MKKTYLLLLVFVTAAPVFAQHQRLESGAFWLNTAAEKAASATKSAIESGSTSRDPQVRNLTMELMQSTEGLASLKKFAEMKADGTIPFARKSAFVPIGTVQFFSVQDATEMPQFQSIEFTKMAEGPGVNIWVETAEMNNGHVRPQDIDDLTSAAANATPGGSFNPNQGSIINDQQVFGDPPDVDGDGMLDVLFVDIRDGYPGSGFAILGFFNPADLTGQNMADIVYVDTFPGLIDKDGNRGTFDSPEQTLAHEYQHLIWSNVNRGGDNTTFINEGQSEWAEVINGFTARRTRYLTTPTELAQPLLGWRGLSSPLVNNDYQRAGLFTNYISDQIGILATGSISRSLAVGINNYIKILGDNGRTLPDVVLDFHTANLINDRSVMPKFGYTVAQYATVRVGSFNEVDGKSSAATPPSAGTLQPGAAFYTRWNDVADMQVDIAGDPSKLLGRFVITSFTGSVSIVDAMISGEGNFLEGDFSNVALILTNGNFPSASSTSYSYTSAWQQAMPNVVLQEVIYDDGQVGSIGQGTMISNAFPLSATNNMATANRFEVPPLSTLSSVRVDHIYLNENPASMIPANAPRDFTLHIWAEDAQGLPGDELVSIELTDTTQPGFFTLFDFMTIPLDAYQTELANLPSVIFVGVSNAGLDENLVTMTVSEFPVGISPSYLLSDTFPPNPGWIPFTGLSIGGDTFAQTVLPIRAVFAIPTGALAVGDPIELPERITLNQNYPNPFNPSTTIEYTMPRSGNARLVVYDMLGRRVATLQDEFTSAGFHRVQFDASNLASGLYLYALETDATKVTRTMTLLR